MLPTQPLRPSEDRSALLMPHANRSGMTLLEVLVACGILVFALSGIAAILPAAGSRLAESVAEDRAALLAANVYADLRASGILDHELFVTSAAPAFNLTPPGPNAQQLRTLALGMNVTNILDLSPTGSDAAKLALDHFFASVALNQIWPYASLPVDARRDFFIQDDLDFTSDTLSSRYESNGLGPRSFKRGVCWGATLAASGTTIGPGSPAMLSIAIFKKPGEIRAIDLTELSEGGSLYSLAAGFENTRSTFLKPCSYVLALPEEVAATAPTRPLLPPKWFRINSSWTQQSSNTDQRISYVSLPTEASQYTTSVGSLKQLRVIGFTGLIRVDEFPVTLR